VRILSGVQPSGKLHLGNYFGAIRQFVELQHKGEALYFIANLHALNSVRDGRLAYALTLETAAAFLALGLDADKAILFRQSDIGELGEAYWVLGTLVPMGNLERAHSYKDKKARGLPADFGLFAYPVLMAADILIYGSDVVPVGKDQIQHLEFCRDWATKFNVAYVPGYDAANPNGENGSPQGIFKLPEAFVCEETAVLLGIDGQKMSKSYGNTIELFGEDKEVKKKMMSIKTDSSPIEAPKPAENSALFGLLQAMAPPGEWPEIETSWREGGIGYGTYKKKLVDYFHLYFDEPRKRFAELMGDKAELEKILEKGAQRARAYAAPIIQKMRAAVGISRSG